MKNKYIKKLLLCAMSMSITLSVSAKVNNTTDGTNSMDMMGQQMEMTIKSSTVTTVNF